MDTDVPWERLAKALDALAGSPLSLQQRLFVAKLDLQPLRPEDFPPDVRTVAVDVLNRFDQLHEAATET